MGDNSTLKEYDKVIAKLIYLISKSDKETIRTLTESLDQTTREYKDAIARITGVDRYYITDKLVKILMAGKVVNENGTAYKRSYTDVEVFRIVVDYITKHPKIDERINENSPGLNTINEGRERIGGFRTRL